ncbi:DUF4365 domain-containing protein [Vibrio fluvialis]|nr:DUF4365 domain-containing protein [Vibrio fluvialis]
MEYAKKTATGNTGEYYFSYWVSRYFRWPCRLLDIDVGVDAQLEVMDENNHTTGDFIAVQIKTTISNQPNVSIDLANLKYWKSMEDVVIIVSITTKTVTPKIYWKVINDENIDNLINAAKKNKTHTTTVTFDNSNQLLETDKLTFSLLPYRGEVEKTNLLISKLIIQCDGQLHSLWHNNFQEYRVDHFDGLEHYESFIDDFNEICNEFDSISSIISKMPKIKSYLKGYNKLKRKLNYLSCRFEELVEFILDVNSEFKNEYKKRWCHSSNHPTVVKIFEKQFE